MITYEKLWNLMKQRGISQYALIKKYNVSPGQITRLKRNESVSTHTIEIFCRILQCDVGDIMQYIPDEQSKASTSLGKYILMFFIKSAAKETKKNTSCPISQV